MSIPYVGSINPQLVRPFEYKSLAYWHAVATVMMATGADQVTAEAFVKTQPACKHKGEKR